MELLVEPSSERQFIMYEALRKGAGVETLFEKTYIKPWFIEQMKDLVECEEKILTFKEKGFLMICSSRPRRTDLQTGIYRTSLKYRKKISGISASPLGWSRGGTVFL